MDSCNLHLSVLEGQTIQPNAGQTTGEQGENSANNNIGGNGENQGEQVADQHPEPRKDHSLESSHGEDTVRPFSPFESIS